jgi:hypothetical protein
MESVESVVPGPWPLLSYPVRELFPRSVRVDFRLAASVAMTRAPADLKCFIDTSGIDRRSFLTLPGLRIVVTPIPKTPSRANRRVVLDRRVSVGQIVGDSASAPSLFLIAGKNIRPGRHFEHSAGTDFFPILTKSR